MNRRSRCCTGDTHLRLLFRRFEQRRSEWAAELQAEARGFEASPPDGGSWSSALHRQWVSLRHVVARGPSEDQRLAAACRQRDAVILKILDEARLLSVPVRLRTMLRVQENETRQSISALGEVLERSEMRTL
jgi:uncharacterized protein (TIGR02284 family)